MSDLIGLSASAAGGGLFGLVGTALGRLAGYFERRQTLKHETRRWAHELDLLARQQDGAREAANAAHVQAEIDGSWDGLRASIDADSAIAPSYLWVNAVRGLTRPFLTLLLWLIESSIWFGADTAGRAEIIETATFAATAATLWWFGDRSPRQSLR